MGRTLAALGVRDAFGVLGSGNFVATQALHAAGAAFHHARHEGGAISMADGYARVSGRVGRLQRPPGPGLHERAHRADRGGQEPHAAARARRRGAARGDPLELRASTSPALAATLGAVPERIHSGATAAADTARALRRARGGAAARRAQPAARRAGRAGARRRRARPAARARAARAGAGGGRRGRRADRGRAAAGDRRRPRRGAGRRARAARAPRRGDRRACSPPPRWATGCSRARRGRSASPAASPRRSRRG